MTDACRLLVLLLVVAGCGGQGDERGPAAEPLVGVWLRPIAGQEGCEGLQFERGGAVRFVNMFSLEGERWERIGADSLRVWSVTGRYPEPAATDYRIVTVTPQQLVLARRGGGTETYDRSADGLVGRWTGPEGTFVDVTPAGDGYRLVIRSGDSLAVFAGTVAGEGIAFTRGGAPCGLVASQDERRDGKTCVVVAPGEGYCRETK